MGAGASAGVQDTRVQAELAKPQDGSDVADHEAAVAEVTRLRKLIREEAAKADGGAGGEGKAAAYDKTDKGDMRNDGTLAVGIGLGNVIKVQSAFRKFKAKMKVRKKAAWKMYNTLEYKAERGETAMSSFFAKLMKVLPMYHESNSGETESVFDKKLSSGWPHNISIPDSYKGPQLPTPMTYEAVIEMIGFFKNEAGKKKPKHLHKKHVLCILADLLKLLKKTKSVKYVDTSISGKFTVVGDLHGQLADLLVIFEKNGLPSSDNPYLFNGDFVDRGDSSLEVALILFSLAVVEPGSVHLNRGNHEDYMICHTYGFIEEVVVKYRKQAKAILNLFAECFSFLPIVTVLDKKIAIVHAGVSPNVKLKELEDVPRHYYKSLLAVSEEVKTEKGDDPANNHTYKDYKAVVDALWSDPDETMRGCEENEQRGAGMMFGADFTRKWLEDEGLEMIVRSHECMDEGYKVIHGGKVVTIFSASNYYEDESNKGAYMEINPELPKGYTFHQYVAGKVGATGKLSLSKRVGKLEQQAFAQLTQVFSENRDTLLRGFKGHDKDGSGSVSVTDWAAVLTEVLALELPWMSLKSMCGEALSADERSVKYEVFLDTVKVHFKKDGDADGSMVSDHLYKNRQQLETVFRLIDEDCSGFLDRAEFHRACDIVNQCSAGTDLTSDQIEQLATAMDTDGDGKINFNEFLLSFRLLSENDTHLVGGVAAEHKAEEMAKAAEGKA